MSRRRSCFWLLAGLALAPGVRAAPEPQHPLRVQTLDLRASDGVAVVAGRPVQFTDVSTGEPTSWAWDFAYQESLFLPDSLEQNPVWTFVQEGLWSVRLEACNQAGCSSAVKQIEVIPPCPFAADLVLSPLDGAITDTQTFEACQTITAGAGFTVADPGAVTLRAGRSVALGSGFSIGSGASFQVVIDPALDLPQ